MFLLNRTYGAILWPLYGVICSRKPLCTFFFLIQCNCLHIFLNLLKPEVMKLFSKRFKELSFSHFSVYLEYLCVCVWCGRNACNITQYYFLCMNNHLSSHCYILHSCAVTILSFIYIYISTCLWVWPGSLVNSIHLFDPS